MTQPVTRTLERPALLVAYLPCASEPALQAGRAEPISALIMLRLLTSLFAALGLLFMPLGMTTSAAMAQPAAVEASMEDHCVGTDRAPDEQRSSAEMGCASACAAIYLALPAVCEHIPTLWVKIEMVRHQMPVGIAPEGETPPPRIIPEV